MNIKEEIIQEIGEFRSIEQQENKDEDDDDGIQVLRQVEGNQKREETEHRIERIEIRKTIKKEKTHVNKQSEPYMYSKQIRDLFKVQKFRELVLLVQNDKQCYQEFDEVRYHGEIYKIGQNIMVNNASNSNDDFIAKLLKIIQIKETKTDTLILLSEVKWYYKKNEIITKMPQHKQWISNHEVFTTDSTDYILTTAINNPCTILSLEEFERLDNIETNVYFTRLGWNPKKNRFDNYDKLRQHCLCKQPINPDLDYIQCDECDEWYHMSCVGVRKGEWDQKDYICGRCR